MNLKSKGFSAIEALIIIVILSAVGVGGFFVYKHNTKNTPKKNPNPSSSSTETSKSTKATPQKLITGIADGPGAGWNTYTNATYGFSIKIPKQFLSSYGAVCAQDATSFRPASGLVPATVVQDGNKFYVVEETTYQLGNGVQAANGTYNYSSCDKTTTTAAVINAGKALLSSLPIHIYDAQNQADILAIAHNLFGNRTQVDSIVNNANGLWQDVGIGCMDPMDGPDVAGCDMNGMFKLRYYPALKKLVYISQGQAYHFFAANGQDNYDKDVIDSFKFL